MTEVAYERVKLARDSKRPTGRDYIKNIFTGFIEFHGDRRYADDPAIVGGIAKLNDCPVTVIAIEKGHTVKERNFCNFGMPQPEGYRKALRLMKQAEKFGRPVICFVDTSGAYCGIGAEERGQGQAIAENLMEMSTLCVPIITILIGEGAVGVHLHFRLQIEFGCCKILYIPSFRPKAVQAFFGKIQPKQKLLLQV